MAARLPERLRGYDAKAALRPLVTVIAVRLLFFLFPPAHWVFGLSTVRFGPFVLGTAIGFAPGMLLLTLVGKGVFEWMLAQPPWVSLVLVVPIVVFFFARYRHGRRAPKPLEGSL